MAQVQGYQELYYPSPPPARGNSSYYQIASPQPPPPRFDYGSHRYDPYRRHQAQPLPSPQPRLMPANHPTSPAHMHPGYPMQIPMPPQKSYETHQSTSRYQPSRGAQRDARWHAKYADRQRSVAHMNYASRIAHARPTYPGIDPSKRVRREQQAAIINARRAHLESLKAKVSEEEQQRRTTRIQLQVYVHARVTKCQWSGCEASLNSWALMEKHLLHAHLRYLRSGPDRIVQCRWNGCHKTFDDAEACHQHCLVGHMGPFSARCPFNCLYEGPEFSELMAHIGRRHPTATPDDFVPGLIHHRPLYLPPSTSDLPKLPQLVVISPRDGIDDTQTSIFRCGDVRPATEISDKVSKLVRKHCISSGRRPRKDHFVDKQAARAAISAMIENSRRISDLAGGTECEEEETHLQSQDHPPLTAVTAVSMTEDEAKERGVELVDVKVSVRQARQSARKMLESDLIVDVDLSSDGLGSRSSSRASSLPTRPQLQAKPTASRSRLSFSPDQDGDTESILSVNSDASSSSRYSLYKGESSGGADVDAQAQGVKRSTRSKRKASGGLSPD